MAAIRELYDLQSVDLELDWRKARLAEIAAALGDERELVPLRSEARRTRAALQAATAKQTDLDNVISGYEEKIAEAEKRLYSGSVRLARELQDLQADIEMIKRQRSEQETLLLEAMDEREQAQAAGDAAGKALADAEAKWQAGQKAMAEERVVLENEVSDLQAKRDAHAARIPAPDLALYEQVRRTHKGRAVALMHGNTCGSCRVALPTRQAQDARTSTKPVRCPNCGLVLLPE